MAAKAWKRSSVRWDYRITEDRKSLVERYMIDAEEAQAREQRAAEEQASRRAGEEVAESWFRDDYEPIVEALGEAGMIGEESETEAYMRAVGERYLSMPRAAKGQAS